MAYADAAERFRLAMLFFNEGRYNDALAGIEGLLREFPDDPNLLAAKVRCLGGLERFDEAHQLCRELDIIHNYPKAFEIDAWLREKAEEGLAGRRRNVKKTTIAQRGASNLWDYGLTWAAGQPAGRLVYIILTAALFVGSLIAAFVGEDPFMAMRVMSCSLMFAFLGLTAIHNVLSDFVRGIYTSSMIIGAISGAVAVPQPDRPMYPAVFLLALILVSGGTALASMFYLLFITVLSSISFSFLQAARESCLLMVLAWSIGLVFFIGAIIYGLIAMALIVVGEKISNLIAGMEDEDDIPMLMTLDVFRDRLRRT